MSRLGCVRPVSRKLRWRVEISASTARPSWLIRRRSRHYLRSLPTGLGRAPRACRRALRPAFTPATIRVRRPLTNYLGGNAEPLSHALFDYPIRLEEQQRRDREAERLGRVETDH